MTHLSSEIASFVVSDAQRRIDLAMVPYDIWGTTAHVIMLEQTGIIPPSSGSELRRALRSILKSWESGTFVIDPERGAQLTLEQLLIELSGNSIGLSAHTARSRNDQVMVTEILYLRDRSLDVCESILSALAAMHNFGLTHVHVIMPGYTHMQPGKPTTVGAWTLSHIDSILRATEAVYQVLSRYNRCPLGAVESYGTSWPIDRELVADLLGFSRVWESTLDAISSRGQFQAELLHSCAMLSLGMSRVASDLMLYTTFEFSLFELGDNVAQRLHPITGSSVMAQKRNPDALELMRSIGPQLSGLQATVVSLLQKLPSAYNRDSREVKEYAEMGLTKVHAATLALNQIFQSLAPRTERMHDLVISNYSLTTDLADWISQRSGLPYRLVYKIVGSAVDNLMQQGKPLSELTASALQSEAQKRGSVLTISDAEIQDGLDPCQAIARRRHLGGPNSEHMRALYTARQRSILRLQGRARAWRN